MQSGDSRASDFRSETQQQSAKGGTKENVKEEVKRSRRSRLLECKEIEALKGRVYTQGTNPTKGRGVPRGPPT